MTQAQIDTALANPIHVDSLKVLKDYAAAAQKVVDAAPDATNSEVVAKNLA